MRKGFYEYYRKDDGNLKGVVVATGKGILGWSMCNPKDIFNKEKGLDIAYRRAEKAERLDASNPIKLLAFYDRVPRTLSDLFEKIYDRSIKYFKDDYTG